MIRVSTLLTVAILATGAARAGTIESACNNAARGASRSLCSCIQQVADRKLNHSDQRLAARFFKDPHLAQETRQSSNRSKERFWQRYKDWGQTAEQACSG